MSSPAKIMSVPRKIPPKQWNYDKLQVFQQENEYEIRNMAGGLTKDEVLQFYGIQMSDLPEYDAWFFNITFDRARIVSKQTAVAKLFTAMNGKDALASSLAYLTRFGNTTWQDESGTGSKIPKEIKIVVE